MDCHPRHRRLMVQLCVAGPVPGGAAARGGAAGAGHAARSGQWRMGRLLPPGHARPLPAGLPRPHVLPRRPRQSAHSPRLHRCRPLSAVAAARSESQSGVRAAVLAILLNITSCSVSSSLCAGSSTVRDPQRTCLHRSRPLSSTGDLAQPS